jgi:hypothetical protein
MAEACPGRQKAGPQRGWSQAKYLGGTRYPLERDPVYSIVLRSREMSTRNGGTRRGSLRLCWSRRPGRKRWRSRMP